ncbi:hypothetical protein TNCV_695211 [Trichonephila clavipes]|nr:hypothetical protein TNCV_695211 [Trichonephila clavipes]
MALSGSLPQINLGVQGPSDTAAPANSTEWLRSTQHFRSKPFRKWKEIESFVNFRDDPLNYLGGSLSSPNHLSLAHISDLLPALLL